MENGKNHVFHEIFSILIDFKQDEVDLVAISEMTLGVCLAAYRGSSREHAVWALRDFGIKIVIASSFGDIFYNNCFKNGVLPIKLDKNKIEDLFQKMSDSSADLSVSLDSKKNIPK